MAVHPDWLARVRMIVRDVRCLDRTFVVTEDSGHLFVHVEYMEADVDAPVSNPPTLQKSRRWVIEPDATETDIVNTCFACIMRSFDHVVQEHFTYVWRPVFSPHTDIAARMHGSKVRA